MTAGTEIFMGWSAPSFSGQHCHRYKKASPSFFHRFVADLDWLVPLFVFVWSGVVNLTQTAMKSLNCSSLQFALLKASGRAARFLLTVQICESGDKSVEVKNSWGIICERKCIELIRAAWMDGDHQQCAEETVGITWKDWGGRRLADKCLCLGLFITHFILVVFLNHFHPITDAVDMWKS